MSLYRRSKHEGAPWWVSLRWRGYPRLQLATGTSTRKVAEAMERTVQHLRDKGRRDLIALLAVGKLRLPDVHQDYLRDPASLEHRVHASGAPTLPALAREWTAWLASPEGLSPKTRAPYSPSTVRRYRESWDRILEHLPAGEAATLADLTRGFYADYRKQRIEAGASGKTVTRDFTAICAFATWLRQAHDLRPASLEMPRDAEGQGRDRWLSADELAVLYVTVPAEWVVVYRVLAMTGLRLGELIANPRDPASTGLLWGDVRFADRQLLVRSPGGRRETTKRHRRSVPLAEQAARDLRRHRDAVPAGPADPVFPAPWTYQNAQRAFSKAVGKLKWPDTRLHDLRHTFGVHAVMSGIPLPRLQKLLGHRTPAMTLRYAMHAPEPHSQDDAARLAASMTAAADREAKALRDLLEVSA